MNDMINFGGNAPVSTESLGNLSTSIAPSAQVGLGGMDLLRLMRDGEWVYGADNTPPEEDSLWAVNPHSFQHGYIAWHDSKVEGEVMVAATQAMPAKAELPDVTEDWAVQLSFVLQCVSGEDEGQVAVFKTTSIGGKKAVGKLAAQISVQAISGSDAVVPICKLMASFYTHKQYGKIYTPEFAVEEWRTMGGDVEAEEEVEEAPKSPPKTRGRKKAA